MLEQDMCRYRKLFGGIYLEKSISGAVSIPNP